VLKKFREIIERWKLFDASHRVLVGVSGGRDSISLLHLLCQLPEKIRPKLVVAHFDHGLRGDQSAEERLFVENLCRQWDVPCFSEKAPIWKDKNNLHDRARQLRYDFFNRVVQEQSLSKILTAHHADDQTETFLMRWLQGAGLKGLAGIPMRRKMKQGNVELIRPLLLIRRKEIAQYVQGNKLPFREDPSNQDSKYLRSRLRKWLQDLEEENPNLSERTAWNALLLRADENYLESVVDGIFYEHMEKTQRGWRCSISKWLALEDSLRYRLLQKIYRELLGEGSAPSIDFIFKMSDLLFLDGSKHYDLPGGFKFQKEGVFFEIFRIDS